MKKRINEVFTARRKEVNEKMYINRTELEESLQDLLDEFKHIIVYGDSGSGKTWLCKKVLKERKDEFGIINLNLVAANKSLKVTFEEQLADKLGFSITEYQKNATIGATAIIRGQLQGTTKEVKLKGNPIRDYMRSFISDEPIIILENLEAIFDNPNLMEELGNLLMLLDDEDYPARCIVVGVPGGVMSYFINRAALKPITNRITELPEVKSMNLDQVREFINRGFNRELQYNLSDRDIEDIAHYVFWVTGGIPQQLHEFGACLAKIIEKNEYVYTSEMLDTATNNWLKKSLQSVYMVIVDMMNSIRTEVGRRNQVLYCLSRIKNTTFTVTELEAIFRSEFPKTASKGRNLSISKTLNDLCAWQNSFIIKNKTEYIIKNKLYILCIRAMLKKDTDEKIIKTVLPEVSDIL